MSNTVFPFNFTRQPRAAEGPDFQTRIVGLNEGNSVRAAEFGNDFKVRIVGSLRFPQSSTSKTLTDWLSFVEGIKGSYDSFLYKCWTDRYSAVSDTATGDGSTKTFALTKKYVDSSSLSVTVSGGATAVTLGSNYTAPTITFSVAPANAAPIVATYDYYIPVYLENEGFEVELLAHGATDATRRVRIDNVTLIETVPGGRNVG